MNIFLFIWPDSTNINDLEEFGTGTTIKQPQNNSPIKNNNHNNNRFNQNLPSSKSKNKNRQRMQMYSDELETGGGNVDDAFESSITKRLSDPQDLKRRRE
jgi:hypothetical protein